MENQKQKAIKLAVASIKKAKTYGGRVGACIYTKTGKFFTGFNVETKIHKGYHAEEVAIINSLIHESKPEEATGVVIVCELDSKGIFPACASCRQFLWEFTNPNLLVTVVNAKGEILFEDTLTNLYPMPYPTNPLTKNHDKQSKTRGDQDEHGFRPRHSCSLQKQ